MEHAMTLTAPVALAAARQTGAVLLFTVALWTAHELRYYAARRNARTSDAYRLDRASIRFSRHAGDVDAGRCERIFALVRHRPRLRAVACVLRASGTARTIREQSALSAR